MEKGWCLDNIYIERFWCTLKQDHIYLNPTCDGREFYNAKRRHQGIRPTASIMEKNSCSIDVLSLNTEVYSENKIEKISNGSRKVKLRN